MWVDRISAATLPLQGREPDLVLLFGPTKLLRGSGLPERLAGCFPGAIHLGCSTGTVIDEATLSDTEPVILAVGFERTRLKLATAALGGAAGSFRAGQEVGAQLAGPGLAGVFMLSAGLDVNGSALVEGLVQAVGPHVVVSGGLAGDGARFSDTVVAVGGVCGQAQVAAIGFYGSSIRIAHGSAGGWDEFGPMRRITRSEGACLFELDGKPALDLYERYLAEEAADLPASGLLYPLKVWDTAHPEESVMRTLLAVDRTARSLTFAGNLPQGWNARLMRGSFEGLAGGAATAARHARDELARLGATPQLCLFVSCVGRRLLMGQRTEAEVEAALSVLEDGTALAGFYSYGEIAPHNHSGTCGLHNQTVTLTLMAEAA